jgi:iron complex outermembrane receptor protein
MRRLICLLFLFFSTSHITAQITEDTLQGVEVRGKHEDVKDGYEAGIKHVGIDPRTIGIYQHQSLADLLAGSTTAFVKSTGLGTFSTLNLRGASAAQSAVYWEGVPLMNSASGLADISILPIALFGDIAINYGSSAVLLGSGNVGGAVMLQDVQPVFADSGEASGKLGIHTGSFSRYGIAGKAQISRRRFFAGIGLAGAYAENDFPASDEQGHTFITQNARQWSNSAAATLAFKLSQQDAVIARGQYYFYDREIPRALFESRSTKSQQNAGYRLLLHWQRNPDGNFRKIYAKAALFSDAFDYSDSSIYLASTLHTRQIFAEAGTERTLFRNGSLLLFSPVQYCWGADMPHAPHQYRVALAGAYTHVLYNNKLKPSVCFRLESFDGKLISLPGANISYFFSKQWHVRANAQYTYRAPTLNELYYNPGGNADLKPEQGWSLDGGLEWSVSAASGWAYHHSLSAYNRNIKDWIVWLGGAIWTPHNLAAVHSRGIESEHTIAHRGNRLTWRLGVNTSYTRSTVTESYLVGDNSIGKQVPYVPMLILTGLASLGWKNFYFQWNTIYTGQRYTVSDESQWLPDYSISNLNATCNFHFKQNACYLQFSMNNLFNKRYEVVAFRPMPGFHWSLNAGINLRKSQ